MEGGKPTIVTNAEGGRTTPSVVAYTKTGERLVGQARAPSRLLPSQRRLRLRHACAAAPEPQRRRRSLGAPRLRARGAWRGRWHSSDGAKRRSRPRVAVAAPRAHPTRCAPAALAHPRCTAPPYRSPSLRARRCRSETFAPSLTLLRTAHAHRSRSAKAW